MHDSARSEYEAHSQTLRAELKQWENSWAKTHGGQKPSREDIKQTPDIAQKYKQYNKVRDIISGKIPPPNPATTTSSTAHKRRSSISLPTAQTPSKRLRTTTTPSVPRFQSYPDTTTPSTNRKLFSTPVIPTSIGPTPQRDGRVLGLFDLLSTDKATPSRPRTGDFISDNPGGTARIQQPATTPRKQTSRPSPTNNNPGSGDGDVEDGGRHGRTPMSSSKRHILDNFLYTPLKDRDNNAGGGSFSARIGISSSRVATTPKSVGKSLFTTPAFLKRNSKPLDTVDENAEDYLVSPRPLRLPRKPIVRGLSSVVAGLRKLEEERLDDDLEALREAEMEMEGVVAPSKPNDVSAPQPGAEVEVEDSQAPKLLGGFDDEALYDSAEEEQLDRGQPLRMFKKKGQKRTTKRVNMRPTRTKRLEISEDVGEEEDVVPETQVGGELEMHGDLTDSEFGEDGDGPEKKAKAREKDKDGEKEGTVKKAVRKVKATAHANFKRLKLRSYGAKGGPGHGSRFKRRR